MNISEYIEYRLTEWADWYLRYGSLGLGYPKKSVEGKMIDNGGILIKTALYDFSGNDSAEEIECLVVELAKQNQRLALVLRERYFGKGTMQNRARCLELSYNHFKILLDMAKQWLAGRLSVNYRERCT